MASRDSHLRSSSVLTPQSVPLSRHRPASQQASASGVILDPQSTRDYLERILCYHERLRDLRVELVLREHGYATETPRNRTVDGLDVFKMEQVTRLARIPGLSLIELIQLIRGETPSDPRPNKALRPVDYRWLLHGYKHCDFMVESAMHGLQPRWLRPTPSQVVRPSNHKSVSLFPAAVARSIRTGQDGGQYLVVSGSTLDHWSDIQISPLGAVEKNGVDPQEEIRLIHDLKRPIGSSTNEATDKSCLPTLDYRPVADLAARIERLHARGVDIYMLKGDVKGAFRHLMVAAASVGWMGARLEDHVALILDLSAPFGWTCSPTYYGAYGGSVTWMVQQESPATLDSTSSDVEPFYAYEWVDDHVLIEFDAGNRLQMAETALRTAMMAVFGPRALNEKKFSAWETRLEVLGLEFDVRARTISMPERKIAKACARIQAMQKEQRTTRSALMKLLGSLRHVCSCSRAVKPFFQRVQALCTRAPLNGTIQIPASVYQDLEWSLALLGSGQFRDLPMSMFAAWPDPDVHLYMDASDAGLAVLDPATRRFIQVRFEPAELLLIADVGGSSSFTINVREQLSVALAATVWGPQWRHRFRGGVGQIWCWVDNMTAVSVSNKLSSRNTMAQELNRRIGLAEAIHGFRIRCLHLPGKMNRMADAASRAWSPPFANLWLSMQQGWTEDIVPSALRRIYETRSGTYSSKAWRKAPSSSVPQRGGSGPTGALPASALRGLVATSQPPVGRGNAPDTVLSKISALSWHHRVHKGYSVGLHAGHLLAVQGMRRLSAPSAARAPATCGRVVRVDLCLRGSKTDQEGRSVVLSLERSGSGWLCPVLAVIDLLLHARACALPPTAPLASTGAGKSVKAADMIVRLREAAGKCGIDPSRMGTHSLRSGGATAMMSAGVDLQAIKQFGRWASDSVDRYTRLTAATTRTLAARMADRPLPSQGTKAHLVGSALHAHH